MIELIEEKAIGLIKDLLSRVLNVQVSDTTGGDSSAGGNKKSRVDEEVDKNIGDVGGAVN